MNLSLVTVLGIEGIGIFHSNVYKTNYEPEKVSEILQGFAFLCHCTLSPNWL